MLWTIKTQGQKEHTHTQQNKRYSCPLLQRSHSASHFCFTVNHSPPPGSLLAADLNQILIDVFCQQESHKSLHGDQGSPHKSSSQTEAAPSASVHVCLNHYGVRAYSVIFQTQDTLFKDRAGPAQITVSPVSPRYCCLADYPLTALRCWVPRIYLKRDKH